MSKATIILKIDPSHPESELIEQAATVLKQGGLVAFPTETVYGLGALALDVTATSGIFKAKGRHSDNPLIVHVADAEQLNNLVSEVSPTTQACMNHFWPGPLTLVMPKQAHVPQVVTAGLDTVAVRCPMHPVARALIQAAGPIAAPSANLSGKPSPTTAQHVIEDLFGIVDIIIDGGSATVGLESTVVDPALGAILRPGSVTYADLQSVGINISETKLNMTPKPSDEQPTSPGQKYKHYAPNAKAMLVLGTADSTTDFIKSQLVTQAEACHIAVLTTDVHLDSFCNLLSAPLTVSLGSAQDLRTIAANLYGCLRDFDTPQHQHITQIYVQADFHHQDDPLALSIMDRLVRACSYDIVDTHSVVS